MVLFMKERITVFLAWVQAIAVFVLLYYAIQFAMYKEEFIDLMKESQNEQRY